MARILRGGPCGRYPHDRLVPALHDEGGSGALNLLGREADTIDHNGEALGAMLATHAAIAVMATKRRQQFQSALASRDLIGQAKGVLMHQFSVDAVRAFELMVKQSQNTSTTVRVVAQQIVDSYVTPPQS